jgi:hypothetical protein
MPTKMIPIIINIAGILGSLIWLMVNPGWEPIVTTLGLIGALIAQIKFGGGENGGINMKQKGGKGSTNYQSGHDINIGK